MNKIARHLIAAAGIFLLFQAAFSQNLTFERIIRMPLWAEVDIFPELKNIDDLDKKPADFKPFEYPIAQLKKITPFLINGMVYGWNFEYTPSDKLRKVQEYFNCTEKRSFEAESSQIKYGDAWIENGKFCCWVQFDRTQNMRHLYEQWSEVRNPRIHGIGRARLEEGFAGIQKASQEAVKNAVREYYRKVIKNKPKEIDGSVLIKTAPTIYVESGNYVVELDFFLETGKITEYSSF